MGRLRRANGIVGGGIPIAAGAALGLQLKGEKHVAVSFFGDGASNEGAFHEGINIAATGSVPRCVCEKQRIAESTPLRPIASGSDIAASCLRPTSMPESSVDGMDPQAVYEVARSDCARRKGGRDLR
ncbi:Acetoin:2,6-dichlorophenolindophenol oxidoreductase subunit alpha [Geodia barretti]|uniref:Acetoin:2,6-dichlorophenolindophenol oxidoreductase subunit alpha n=1 Tax=Geodia barretti TaxID=519541 RepID=A0AA35W183_GEOBA|nr:Acetoin:2,6-dichlorophenolindophenol oxidoreductase subunit alpha [Geodia barretti]